MCMLTVDSQVLEVSLLVWRVSVPLELLRRWSSIRARQRRGGEHIQQAMDVEGSILTYIVLERTTRRASCTVLT